MDQQDKGAHTPGPWEAKQEFANRWRIEAPTGPDCIPLSVGFACTTALEVGVSNHNTAANARLIAAAPELYEALRWMVQRADEAGYPDGACLAMARAALAKATGSQQ